MDRSLNLTVYLEQMAKKGKYTPKELQELAETFDREFHLKAEKDGENDASVELVPSAALNRLLAMPRNHHTTLPASTLTGNMLEPSIGRTCTTPPIPTVTVSSVSIRPYSGQEADHTAHDFIARCEHVMTVDKVITDGDKIAFFRSHLVPGSRAWCLMQSWDYSYSDTVPDYATLKKQFLTILGSEADVTLLQQIIHVVEEVQGDASTCSLWDGLVGANQLANKCIKSLHDNQWFQGDLITMANVKHFLEWLFYMFLIPGEARCAAFTLFGESCKTGDELVHSITELKDKLMQFNNSAESPTSTLAPLSPLVAEAEQDQSHVPAPGKPPHHCTFCNRLGHNEKRCYRRQKEMRKVRIASLGAMAIEADQLSGSNHCVGAKSSPASHLSSHQHGSWDGGEARPPSRPPRVVTLTPRGPLQFCLAHGWCKHTSDQCTNIAKQRNGHQLKVSESGAQLSWKARYTH